MREIEPTSEEPIIQDKSESILPKEGFQINDVSLLIGRFKSSRCHLFSRDGSSGSTILKAFLSRTVWLKKRPRPQLLHQLQPAQQVEQQVVRLQQPLQ